MVFAPSVAIRGGQLLASRLRPGGTLSTLLGNGKGIARRSLLSKAVQDRADALRKRYDEILDEMNDPSNYASASLGKELSVLSPVASLCDEMESVREECDSILELLEEAASTKDTELEAECRKEVDRLEASKAELEDRMLSAVLPREDEDYTSNAVIEVRSGTGGDEASLFAGELLESYRKTARAKRWKVEILSRISTEIGGTREATLSVTGSQQRYDGDADDNVGPYGFFKYESGVHRVQRVPVNDSRIHTSACSVAVLPSNDSNDDSDYVLPASELKIETMRASGAGGQHVNTTDSAVRITHIPTGLSASIQDERSQHKNKQKALQLLAARVRDAQLQREQRERGEMTSSLMGGGDRSERIRTYNAPQDRVTDHRCKVSAHGMDRLLTGELSDGLVVTFMPHLRAMRREELLRELENTTNNTNNP